MNINELPLEVLEEILSYLPTKEQFQCERVCKRWQSIACSSVKILAFGISNGCDQHGKLIRNLLNGELCYDNDIMNTILTKCGYKLRSFFGCVTHETALSIVENCHQLRCIDMEFKDSGDIKLLVDTFGKQLTCAHIYVDVAWALANFVPACPKLTSLGINYSNNYETKGCNVSLVKAFETEDGQRPQAFFSLKNLQISTERCLKDDVVKRLNLFANLERISLYLSSNKPMPMSWNSVWKTWARANSRIEVSCFQETSCLGFETLPPGLEFLSVEILGWVNLNPENRKLFSFSCLMPRLKIIELYYREIIPAHLSAVLLSISHYCPALEEFALGGVTDDDRMDDLLIPLLSFTNLKRLSLEWTINISDCFAAKLVTDLVNLRTLDSCSSYCSSLYTGPLFWKALRVKAKSHPSHLFTLQGKVVGTLKLQKLLPPNVSLRLEEEGTIKLMNGFGSSEQWHTLTNQWCTLSVLSLEMKGSNLILNGIPPNLWFLTIKCLNDSISQDTLLFNTLAPALSELSIFQQNMSNEQLGATLESLGQFCPQVRRLCIDRGNSHSSPVDDQITHLLECKKIRRLCMTDKFFISDICGAELAKHLEDLTYFGCYFEDHDHNLGFEFGSIFLKALAMKQRYVWLKGGPSKREVQKRIKAPEMMHYFNFS